LQALAFRSANFRFPPSDSYSYSPLAGVDSSDFLRDFFDFEAESAGFFAAARRAVFLTEPSAAEASDLALREEADFEVERAVDFFGASI
jgi:hypothetical protein